MFEELELRAVKAERSLNHLLHSERGSGFVEKLLLIALFAFVVAVGIDYVTAAVDSKIR